MVKHRFRYPHVSNQIWEQQGFFFNIINLSEKKTQAKTTSLFQQLVLSPLPIPSSDMKPLKPVHPTTSLSFKVNVEKNKNSSINTKQCPNTFQTSPQLNFDFWCTCSTTTNTLAYNLGGRGEREKKRCKMKVPYQFNNKSYTFYIN